MPTEATPLTKVPSDVPASGEAVALATHIARTHGSIAEAFNAVGNHLHTSTQADVVTALLTTHAPDGPGWQRLGQRGALREWNTNPDTISMVGQPGKPVGPDNALSVRWLSQYGRSGTIDVADTSALPPEGAQDAQELNRCGVHAMAALTFQPDGAMCGSLSLARATPGPWADIEIADLRLLGAALTARLAAERSRVSLVDAIARGDQVRAAQHRFFSTLGHELRTPLAAIVGTAELLATATPSPTPTAEPQVAEDAQVILDAADRLGSIVDALLGAGHELGSDAAQATQVPVADAVRDVIHWLGAPAQASNATVTSTVPSDLAVTASPTAVRQILSTLVGNAITHAGPGVEVAVSAAADYDELGARRVRISVRDNGPGLTPEQQADAFTPFTRYARDDVPGTGLGLALTRAVAERNGGLMGVEAVAGAGSSFWVDLPA